MSAQARLIAELTGKLTAGFKLNQVEQLPALPPPPPPPPPLGGPLPPPLPSRLPQGPSAAMSSIFDEIKKVGKARAQRVKVVGYSLIGSQCEVAKDTSPEFPTLEDCKAALISTKQDDIKQLKEKIAHHGNKLESANLFKKHEEAGIHARAIENLTKKQNAAEKVIAASRPEAEKNGKLYEVILAQLKSSDGEIDLSKMKLLFDTLLDKKEQISTWTPNFIAQEFVNLGLGSVPGFTPGATELTLTIVEAALRQANLSPETIAAVKQNLGGSGEEVVAGNRVLQSEIESLKRQINVFATKTASVQTPQNESVAATTNAASTQTPPPPQQQRPPLLHTTDVDLQTKLQVLQHQLQMYQKIQQSHLQIDPFILAKLLGSTRPRKSKKLRKSTKSRKSRKSRKRL
ncbi:hypothetical protein HDU81_005228 [Chytriomyces hyalinus]|nr:hypothetical protein HDU81_005228 [Chytriomyces hyalinus]